MAYEQQLQALRQDYLVAGEGAETCGTLALRDSIQEWLEEIARRQDAASMPAGTVLTWYYLFLREADDKVVGFVQIHHPLNDYYEKFAGHIGYTICPSERRKGYASALLKEALRLCREKGIDEVLVCCAPDNEGSKRTILRCGGVLEATEPEPKHGSLISRYKITSKE